MAQSKKAAAGQQTGAFLRPQKCFLIKDLLFKVEFSLVSFHLNYSTHSYISLFLLAAALVPTPNRIIIVIIVIFQVCTFCHILNNAAKTDSVNSYFIIFTI